MAGSIKLFSFNRKYSHVIGIYPPQSNQSDQPSINSRNWIFIISFVLSTLSSAAFLFFGAKSMPEYGLSFFATSTAIFIMCVYLIMLWQMKNTWPFIENCERFIEKRENSIAAYREIIEKIDRLCEFIGIAMISTLFFELLPFLLYSLINFYILDLGEESFFLFIPVKWPFDWKTPLGYFVAWCGQSAGFTVMELTGIIFSNFLVGSFWLFMFMAEDITKDLAAFNIDVRANANRAEWTKRFCDLVQLYSDGKECVNEFNAIVNYSLFTALFFFMLSESSTLLTLQFQFLDKNAKLIETFMVSISALWIFIVLFAICELGERVTYHFEMFGEELERCNWHMLPIKMQRIYLIFLSDTQQPKNITCYGNIRCARKTFKMISKKAWSYFMTLRQFEA